MQRGRRSVLSRLSPGIRQLLANHASWDTAGYYVRCQGPCDDGIGAHHGVVTDLDSACDCRLRRDPHVRADANWIDLRDPRVRGAVRVVVVIANRDEFCQVRPLADGDRASSRKCAVVADEAVWSQLQDSAVIDGERRSVINFDLVTDDNAATRFEDEAAPSTNLDTRRNDEPGLIPERASVCSTNDALGACTKLPESVVRSAGHATSDRARFAAVPERHPIAHLTTDAEPRRGKYRLMPGRAARGQHAYSCSTR